MENVHHIVCIEHFSLESLYLLLALFNRGVNQFLFNATSILQSCIFQPRPSVFLISSCHIIFFTETGALIASNVAKAFGE